MFVVNFPSMRLVEYTDPRVYNQRVGQWLTIREAENCYILGAIPQYIASADNPLAAKPRLFAVEDSGQIVAATILAPGGCLLMTWASPDMKKAIADGLLAAKLSVTSIYAPCHVSWRFARMWAERTGLRYDVGRAERIYQLSRLAYKLPPSGKLELATANDRQVIRPWVEGFQQEAKFENSNIDALCNELLASRVLYIWKDPHPVAMAAWVCETPHGGSINFVYTPPHLRGRGYGAAVTAALGERMLSNGKWFCFILTDPEDTRTNHIYQKVGARTLCELLRCPILPAEIPANKASLTMHVGQNSQYYSA